MNSGPHGDRQLHRRAPDGREEGDRYRHGDGVANPANGTSVNINCGTTCFNNNAKDTVVTLTAVPDADSNFLSWVGCTSAAGPTCTVTMTTAARTVTATFNSVTITVARNGAGTGTVVGTDPGATIDCGTTCTQKFPTGTVVHLQANNTDPTSAFTAWSGCTSPSGNLCAGDGVVQSHGDRHLRQ